MPEARWMHRKAEEADSSAIGDDDNACFPPAAVGPSLPPAAVGQARRRLDPADPGRTYGPDHQARPGLTRYRGSVRAAGELGPVSPDLLRCLLGLGGGTAGGLHLLASVTGPGLRAPAGPDQQQAHRAKSDA